METLTHVFTLYCIVFTLWMCFRWSSREFFDSMIKVSLFLSAVAGVLIELKKFNII